MALLYRDELQRSHYAPLFSRTSCIYFILVLICIILPFLLVLRTHNFWLVDTFHYEQPQVTHLNEMIVVIYTDQQTYHAGTTAQLNQLLSNNKGVAGILDIETQDYNNDGRAEEITVNIGLTGVAPSEVKSVFILQSISYGIQDTVSAKMKLPIFSIFQTPGGFAKLHVHGTLNMQQKSAFARGAIKREVNFEEFHFAENLLTQNYFDLLNEVNRQNVTLQYDIDNQYIQEAQTTESSDEMAQISLTMRVPYSQRIRVKLPFLETIKLAWIQYFSFFILIWVVIYQLTLGYAFKNNIVETTTSSEIHRINKNYLLQNPVKKHN